MLQRPVTDLQMSRNPTLRPGQLILVRPNTGPTRSDSRTNVGIGPRLHTATRARTLPGGNISGVPISGWKETTPPNISGRRYMAAGTVTGPLSSRLKPMTYRRFRRLDPVERHNRGASRPPKDFRVEEYRRSVNFRAEEYRL